MTPEDIRRLKEVACDAIDAEAGTLNNISQEVWKNPELFYEEFKAHKLLTDYLAQKNFKVEPGFKIDTAFRATFGSCDDGGKPNVAVMCEYDALPDIGHACGHNLIAEVGLAAGIGIQAAMKSSSTSLGQLTVLGTPAEEAGGGKIDLIKAGCLKDIDAACMAHPGSITAASTPIMAMLEYLVVLGTPAEEAGGGKIDLIDHGAYKEFDAAMMAHPDSITAQKLLILTCTEVFVTYKGKASHAAGFPWEGVNALDAAVLAYQNISCLRQQLKTSWRVHGVILNGGAKPNIIPEETLLHFYLRTPSRSELESFIEKATNCFDAAAKATGCTVEYKWDPKPYYNMLSNKTMGDLYRQNAESLGVEFCTDTNLLSEPSGSTDMGNVSHEVPAIHPHFFMGTTVSAHSHPFREAAGAPEAQPYTIAQGKALAMTAIDLYTSPELLKSVKEDFASDKARDAASA